MKLNNFGLFLGFLLFVPSFLGLKAEPAETMSKLKQAIEESKEREKSPEAYANFCDTCQEYVEEPMMVCGPYNGPDQVKLFLHRHLWEPKFRDMVELAAYGFQKIARIEGDSVAGIWAKHYLSELEELAKKGLE